MEEVVARVKKWGSSLGVVIPAPVVRERGIQAGDQIRIRIERAEPTVGALYGCLREELKDLDWEWVERELSTGWDDD